MRKKIASIMYSKDRAMQLDLLLSSYYYNCVDIADTTDIFVLYKTSNDIAATQYKKVSEKFPNVIFILETTIVAQTISILSKYEFVCFLVDDTIFTHDYTNTDIIDVLNTFPTTIGFSLRLGKNTTYCYMHKSPQALPLYAQKDNILLYAWKNREHDFGYPMEISSSIYRTTDIIPLLKLKRNATVIGIEGTLSKYRNNIKKPDIACFTTSVAFSAPINKVRTEGCTPCGRTIATSAADLQSLYEDGYTVDFTKFKNFISNSCHQEVEFSFV